MKQERRFGPDFVSAQRNKYGGRPRSARPLTFDIAVLDEYEPWRQWLDEQVALLSPTDADVFARKLWLDESHWPSIFELAAGAALRDRGFDIVYEREYGGKTPDWTILTSDGSPAMFLEVHTDQPAKETAGRIRGWHHLDRQISKIPVGVVVALANRTNEALRPPDAGKAKLIARELRARLLGSSWTSTIDAHGYKFVVIASPYGGTMRSPNGLHTFFAAPSGIAGVVSAERLSRAVDGKVSKYAAVAEHYDVPLVVAVGAHRFTGVDLSHVDGLLAGEPRMTFQFNLGDAFIGENNFNPGHPSRWTMPAGLSGLLWLHNQPPFQATARANADAIRPTPQSLTASVTDDSP